MAATYEAPTALQTIASNAFIPGRPEATADVDALRDQGNTAWSGSGPVWLHSGWYVASALAAQTQIVQIPPQAGILGAKIGICWQTVSTTATVTVTIDDETGELDAVEFDSVDAAPATMFAWDDLAWSRATDGWIRISIDCSAVAVSSFFSVLIVPYPQTTGASEADGWIDSSRTTTDEGLSVRLANQLLTQVSEKWQSNDVFFTRIFPDVVLVDRGTPQQIATSIPVRLRPGRTLGFSVQGYGLATAVATLHLGADSKTLTTWTGTTAIKAGALAAPSTGGEFSASVSITSDGGTFTLQSISVYEEPEA